MDIVFAVTSAMTSAPDGTPLMVREGEPWDANDAFVKANPGMFGDCPPHKLRTTTPAVAVPEIEQATRAPGEVRRGRRTAR